MRVFLLTIATATALNGCKDEAKSPPAVDKPMHFCVAVESPEEGVPDWDSCSETMDQCEADRKDLRAISGQTGDCRPVSQVFCAGSTKHECFDTEKECAANQSKARTPKTDCKQVAIAEKFRKVDNPPPASRSCYTWGDFKHCEPTESSCKDVWEKRLPTLENSIAPLRGPSLVRTSKCAAFSARTTATRR